MMGELINSPGDRTGRQKQPGASKTIAVPERLRPEENDQPREYTEMIHVPERFLSENSRVALGEMAARSARQASEGRSGTGIERNMPMPADPSKVPGWDGTVIH